MSAVRAALRARSSLRPKVCDGLGAVEREHRRLIAEPVRTAFEDSLDIDEGLREGRDTEHRWDYLLGHAPAGVVVALEPHSAYTSEVSVVIAKRARAKEQLREHLRDDAHVAAWFWVASGRVDFVPHDKQLHRLDQAGITFVGRQLGPNHLQKLRR